MTKLLILIGALLGCLVLVQSCGTVLDAFKRHELIPDVLDDGPNSLLKVIYPSFPTTFFVNLGNKLTVSSVQIQPTVVWPEADPEKYYTLAMVDPDATSRANPTLRNVLHWLVGNIKGNDLNGAVTLSPYQGSAPPINSGLHRYAFYWFEQKDEVTDYSGTVIETILNFSLKDFVAQYELGTPLAGCFYQAQNAENEKKIMKKV